MRYLTLTSDSSKYQCNSVGDTAVVQWNVHHDFTNISDIGITSITFSGFKKTQGHDVKVPIYSNLITRTVTNPKRNILTVRIPKNSSVAEFQLNMSRCNVWFAKYIHIFLGTHEIAVTQVDQIILYLENIDLHHSQLEISVTFSLHNG